MTQVRNARILGLVPGDQSHPPRARVVYDFRTPDSGFNEVDRIDCVVTVTKGAQDRLDLVEVLLGLGDPVVHHVGGVQRSPVEVLGHLLEPVERLHERGERLATSGGALARGLAQLADLTFELALPEPLLDGPLGELLLGLLVLDVQKEPVVGQGKRGGDVGATVFPRGNRRPVSWQEPEWSNENQPSLWGAGFRLR